MLALWMGTRNAWPRNTHLGIQRREQQRTGKPYTSIYQCARRLPGTRKYHVFTPISLGEVLTGVTSSARHKKTFILNSLQQLKIAECFVMKKYQTGEHIPTREGTKLCDSEMVMFQRSFSDDDVNMQCLTERQVK